MPLLMRLLGHPYYQVTRIGRRWNAARAAAAGRAAVIVPVFHRVADDRANGWTTSTKAFREAIRWLQRNFDLISLEEAQRRLRDGRNDRESVCVTFDDGYAINCETAIPLLVEEQVPCTYFVTVEPVLNQEAFVHDQTMGKALPPNTVRQLCVMASAGIEIGAHTRTHPDLGKIQDRARLFDEIVVSRDELSQAIGRQIRYFAFPFGDYQNLSPLAFSIAKEAGFDAVCSNYGGYNFPGDDPFHLQRRGVDGEVLRIKNWVHRDPFRHRNVRRIDYATRIPTSFEWCHIPTS